MKLQNYNNSNMKQTNNSAGNNRMIEPDTNRERGILKSFNNQQLPYHLQSDTSPKGPMIQKKKPTK